MAPSRRQISGRSPLVNPQRQITSFFVKSASSPSPSPSPLSNHKTPKSNPNPSPNPPSPSPPLSNTPKSNPNPNPPPLFNKKTPRSNPNPSSPSPSPPLSNTKTKSSSPARSPSPGPTTPSPVHPKLKKPLLVIGQTPSPPKFTETASYGDEVVGKEVRVYWPLDKKWYDGSVTSYDKSEGKHMVEYEDGEEESLDLGKEKIEWVVVGGSSGARFKRLRRGASASRRVVSDDDDVEMGNVEEEKEDKSEADDSSDEDWGKNVEKEVCESEEDDVELDAEDDTMDEEEEDEVTPSKADSRKRKKSSEVAKPGGEKKFKTDKDTTLKGFKASVVEPVKKIGEADRVVKGLDDNVLDGDALARFGARESEKFRFMGVDRRDAKRRRPSDENYDPRTLYLPPDFVKKLTGGQRQWWEFKSKHMDKVLFFKMGKFYELYEMDAHVGAKELDLRYMKGEQPHCGFPEKNFSVNIEKLVQKGYRVLVVEQTETPDQLERRRKEKGSKDKVVKREICAVVTRGTLTDGEMVLTNPDASYLMSLTEGGESLTDEKAERNFGVCLVDVATKKIILGQFKDDQDCSALSCVLSEIRPVEIIKPANVLSSATERTIVRYTRNPLVNNLVPLSEFWDAEKTIHEVGTFYKGIICQPSSAYFGEGKIVGGSSLNNESGSSFLPKMLSELANGDKNGNLALSALGGAIYYLRKAFLDESLLRYAKFESLPYSDFSNFTEKQHMVLDAAALENLEIFENSRNGGVSGTLYAQLNQCITASGKRLLKTWLARPLYNPELIKERQDAVAILRGENLPYSLEFRKALSRLPDMERLIARIFSSIEASGRNGDKVVLYEDVAKKQLQEFISTLRGCETMVEACSSLRASLEHDKSRRLRHLLTPGQSLPNISPVIKYFKDAFDWVEAHSSGRIVPHEGADEEYDLTCNTVKELEFSLTKHLKEQRKLIGDASIKYVTVGKDEYLLEVPESLSGSVPQDYELCSSKKGVFRYWNPTIKKLLKELAQAKSEQESALKTISQRLIGRFCEHQEEWRQLVSATAELDVLISLAFASDSYEGARCRPVISGSTSVNVPHLSSTGLGHPVLKGDSLGRGSFVPNDVKIGGSKKASFILLTGPNMGGKSTLLRQVCLAVILAQIGADVPAETFELSPVDRIFVRMGAKDHIMAGQSTFLTELSETAVMLSSATRNSLVVLDELGRGTATSDGQAIAESVLEHFIKKVYCRGMFSTHYHRLSMDYQTNPQVSLCHMGCQVGEGSGGVEEVTFLYRLTPGACPKSYGVNVARLAGLPDDVLQRAVIKSQEFEGLYGKNHKKAEGKMGELIKEIISVVPSTSKHSLSELHYKANTYLRFNQLI